MTSFCRPISSRNHQRYFWGGSLTYKHAPISNTLRSSILIHKATQFHDLWCIARVVPSIHAPANSALQILICFTYSRCVADGLVAISEDKLPLLNKSVDQEYMRVPPELGGGYAANIEVFHQIHCLVLLLSRQSLDRQADTILESHQTVYVARLLRSAPGSSRKAK